MCKVLVHWCDLHVVTYLYFTLIFVISIDRDSERANYEYVLALIGWLFICACAFASHYLVLSIYYLFWSHAATFGFLLLFLAAAALSAMSAFLES